VRVFEAVKSAAEIEGMDLNDALEVVRLSDIGLQRDRNEDVVASDLITGLVLLADGMGGYKAGDVASEIAALSITAEVAEAMQPLHGKRSVIGPSYGQILSKAVNNANKVIYQLSGQSESCAGMGTTLIAGIFADDRLMVGHVGDSRLYRLREGKMSQLTQDHSYVQEMVNAGELTEAQARLSANKHLVTRALGVDVVVELELHEHEVHPQDIYLFCSDGLTDAVGDEEIQHILLNSSENLKAGAHALVRIANNYGGTDNISVILVGVKKSFANKRNWMQRLLRNT
jgi:PPM family protein phosphatase